MYIFRKHRFFGVVVLFLLVASLGMGCRQNSVPTPSATAVSQSGAESIEMSTPTPTVFPPITLTITSSPTVAPSITPTTISTVPPPSQTPIMVQRPPSAPEFLPAVEYLGEGPNQFQAPAGFQFMVKRNNPYRVEYEAGPTYQAKRNERVWIINTNEHLFKVFEEEYSFGHRKAGCKVSYVQIDDDEDNRRNLFYLDGVQVHLMAQGMRVYGDFTLDSEGTLTLYANDSIAAKIEVDCPIEPPSDPNTPTPITPPTLPPITETPSVPTGGTETPPPPPGTNTPTPTPTVEVGPAYTRFNFEMAGHVGRDGMCYMKRDTGDLLLAWEMRDGWTDSSTHPLADAEGWIPVYIPHVNIYVEVFCDDGSGLVRMNIHNGVVHPDKGQIVGWLSRGVRNAMEIGWP